MFLQNTVLKLRAVEPTDLEALYNWENDTEIWVQGNSLTPYSKLALRQYINDTQLLDIYQSKQLRLIVDLQIVDCDVVAIGAIDLYDLDVRNQRAGVGIFIAKEYRGKQYASQSLALIGDYAFRFLHLHQLYAYIALSNKPSQKLFERAGYEPIGVLKEWIQLNNGFEDVQLVQHINEIK